MVKHTQTICRQQLANYLTVLDHFLELVLKGLTGNYYFVRSYWFQVTKKSIRPQEAIFFRNILLGGSSRKTFNIGNISGTHAVVV